MLWSPARVAGFAYTAGFRGNDLGRATAVALAVSGGDDGYRWTAGAPPYIDQVGLWGIDVARWPQWSPDDLGDPRGAAAAAWVLYTLEGASFGGFPPVSGDALSAVIPVARAAAEHPVFVQPMATTPRRGGPGTAFYRAYNGTLALLDAVSQPIRLG